MHTRYRASGDRLNPLSGLRACLLFSALLSAMLVPLVPLASTRDDIERLNAKIAALARQVQEIEARQGQVQKELSEIASRLDAVSRASQTAELRTDMDQIKRQVEILSSQLSSLKGEALRRMPLPEPVQPEIPQQPLQAPVSRPTDAQGDSIYSQALKDFNLGRYDLAASEFREYLEAAPQETKAGNAVYWVGECYYRQKRFKEAKDSFLRVVENYPKSPKSLAARYKLGRCLIELGETKKGRQVLESLSGDSPDSEEGKMAESYLDSIIDR